MKELPASGEPPEGMILIGPPIPGTAVARALYDFGLSADKLEIPAEGYVLAIEPGAVVAAGQTIGRRTLSLIVAHFRQFGLNF